MGKSEQEKRQERVSSGMLNTLSMSDFEPDQRLIDAALNEGQQPQEGDQSDRRFEQPMPIGPLSHGTRKSPGF